MGWDVSIARVTRSVEAPFAMSSVADPEELFLRAPDARTLRTFLEREAVPNGPELFSFEDIPELSPSDGSIFVGHAKLEPLLRLYTMLDQRWPGWLLLDYSRCVLHDPASLRRELERRRALVEAYRSR